MATRPVFVPDIQPDSPRLFHEHEVDFQWTPGATSGQKKSNIDRLHAAAGHRNLTRLLDVTPESGNQSGSRVLPSNLAVEDDRHYIIPVLAAFHGSKVFASGGPFVDLYRKSQKDVLIDPRLTGSGKLHGYRFMGLEWGLKSESMFYDWLVVQSIDRYPGLNSEIRGYGGFTEISCPSGGVSICHARSCALYVGLAEKNLLGEVAASQDLFIKILIQDPFYQGDGSPASGSDL